MNNTKIIASVVIPAHGRDTLLVRAVNSILNSNASEYAEIIVDDASRIPITLDILRSQDKIIRLDVNSGAAVARNIGIKASVGEVVYLLDSDDYFLDRDFNREFMSITDKKALYFSNIESQIYCSKFPEKVVLDSFFDSIFFKAPHICQTSSLYFHKTAGFEFDEAMPKHQDWDFVLFSALLKGRGVRLGTGSVYFDRGDRASLSRASNADKSLYWFNKLKNLDEVCNLRWMSTNQVKYFLFGRYSQQVGFYEFYRLSIILLIHKKVSFYEVLKRIYYRIF